MLSGLVDKFHDLRRGSGEVGSAIDERVIAARLERQETLANEVEGLAAEDQYRGHKFVVSADQRLSAAGKRGSCGGGFRTPHPTVFVKDAYHSYTTHLALRRTARRLEKDFQTAYGTDSVTLRFVLGQRLRRALPR